MTISPTPFQIWLVISLKARCSFPVSCPTLGCTHAWILCPHSQGWWSLPLVKECPARTTRTLVINCIIAMHWRKKFRILSRLSEKMLFLPMIRFISTFWMSSRGSFWSRVSSRTVLFRKVSILRGEFCACSLSVCCNVWAMKSLMNSIRSDAILILLLVSRLLKPNFYNRNKDLEDFLMNKINLF